MILSLMIEQNKQMSILESHVEQLPKEIEHVRDTIVSSYHVSSIEKYSSEDLTKELSSLSLKNQEIDDLKKCLQKVGE